VFKPLENRIGFKGENSQFEIRVKSNNEWMDSAENLSFVTADYLV
jgi:hypothetical protein